MDPLSDVLSLLKISNFAARGFEAGGEWSIRFGAASGIKLFAIISGSGWIAVEGVDAPIQLVAGDCLLLASGRPYHVASDLHLPSIDGAQLLAGLGANEVARFSEGSGCLGIAGYFDMEKEHAELLLSVLPPVLHINEEADKQDLRWYLERIRREFAGSQAASFLVAQQLATLVLIQVLRTYLASQHQHSTGWLFALADQKVGSSLRAMHQQPGDRWTLDILARHVGMSRTGFAVRFKELVGVAPMTYLTQWRMSLAKNRMRYSPDAFSVVAAQVGYESESAFSTAFKRVVGCSPRQYVNQLSSK